MNRMEEIMVKILLARVFIRTRDDTKRNLILFSLGSLVF